MAIRSSRRARGARPAAQHRARAARRVSALTERLTALLSDRNRDAIAGILDNLEEVSRNLAERSPEIAADASPRRAIAIR